MKTANPKTIALSCIAVALLAGAAAAQEVDPMIDVNGDGMLSFPELLTAYPAMTEEAFSTMDTTGDGVLDADETAAAIEAGQLTPTEG
ncbi:hypothetical protein [Flavimaricola marinus]|uniref:EF hand n=1 Tax=Flavimaricola marinus TaxID=1819565 RepID=A0A238LJ97_9RHOB|nr:hypothetical protein [Flavimaricola marinus]SMY09688.1 EF hand [Flavimaricola marinus]